MPKEITIHMERKVYDLVRVIIPEGIEHKHEFGFDYVRDPERPNVWMDMTVAAKCGLVRVEPIIKGEQG